MQEAFMQVRAYAGETRAPREIDRLGNDRLKPDLFRFKQHQISSAPWTYLGV
jgi:hypothetical protein